MVIRAGERRDVKRLLDIYNYEVECATATFDLTPRTLEERMEWFEEHRGHHPLIVAEKDGEVAGYATLSPYRTKEAYKSTVELSVYVDAAFRGQGIGKALMEEILRMAREDETLHTVISVITGGNAVSTRIHEEFGFIHCGTMREVGEKFGKLLDIDNYQLMV